MNFDPGVPATARAQASPEHVGDRIADNGPGLPGDVMVSLFRPLGRTRRGFLPGNSKGKARLANMAIS
jgi:nitrogen-specific signal transduction histidine kinase